jgi:hypothetical protein
MKKRIVIFSSTGDLHADRVIGLLPSSVEAIRLNLDDPSMWSLSYLDGDIRISTDSDTFGLEELLSVFVRRIPSLESFKQTVSKQYVQYEDYIAHQQFFLFSDCLAVLDGTKPFINPLASASLAGKAVQAKIAQAVGLLTPRTYMGCDPATAFNFSRELVSKKAQICTKPIINKKVRIGGEDHTRYTEVLAVPPSRESLQSLESCPAIFQEYIPKAYEIRATVVADQIFAARIDSQSPGGGTAIDWRRYNVPKTPHSAYTLPPTVEDQIITLQQRLNLKYSAFDFIRTPDGEYVFLETNPFGQWLWIEDLTGLPISKAIAEFLVTPSA